MYSVTILRAKQTAEILGKYLGIKSILKEELIGIYLGKCVDNQLNA